MPEEDQWLLDNLKVPDKGVFIEVGAYDGLSGSTTLKLEQMGWKGFLVEPDPVSASRCKANRQNKTFQCGVSNRPGLTTFYIDPTGCLSWTHPNRKPISIYSYRLERLIELAGYQDKRIDLLSISTGGTELDIWFSIGNTRPGVVIIGHNTSPYPPETNRVVKEMEIAGYSEVWRNSTHMTFTLAKRGWWS